MAIAIYILSFISRDKNNFYIFFCFSEKHSEYRHVVGPSFITFAVYVECRCIY